MPRRRNLHTRILIKFIDFLTFSHSYEPYIRDDFDITLTTSHHLDSNATANLLTQANYFCRHDHETTVLNNSSHGCFPRNCASLKRTSMDECHVKITDSDSPKEASRLSNDNASKRAKTDGPFGQSEDRCEKLIFFSATSLAQSPESTRSAQIRDNTPKHCSH